MKTTLHYLLTILLLSLTTIHVRAATGDEGPFKITDVNSLSYQYNDDSTSLTISGSGKLTITGDGKPVDCNIIIAENAQVTLTIKDLHISTKDPLQIGTNGSDTLKLVGTNTLDATSGAAIKNQSTKFHIQGNGSLTLQGAEGSPAMESTNQISKNGNTILVAIDGKGVTPPSYLLNNVGLFIHGKVSDTNSIEHVSSELAGDLTIANNFEIPDWAQVTIPNGQSITIPENVTLTNKGTLTLETNSTLTNKGTLSLGDNATFDKTNGTFNNESIVRIGDNGFDITKVDPAADWNYDSTNKLLTLEGKDSITIEGKGQPVDCSIEIKGNSTLSLIIKDLHIKGNVPLTVENSGSNETPSIIVQGINVMESNATNAQPGILLNGNMKVSGIGSLTVKGSPSGGAGVEHNAYNLTIEDAIFQAEGGTDASGMDCSGNTNPLTITKNAYVTAIGGKGASGINQSTDSLKHENGLLIIGSVHDNDTIFQYYAELVGDITIATDTELPAWANITVSNGQTFSIADGVTFTNYGEISNRGTISSDRVKGNPPEHYVIFKANDQSPGSDMDLYIPHDSTPPDTIFTRPGYTFQGWYDARESGTQVTVITHPQTLFAYWINNNPPPPPPPPPTVYYTVTLPEVEGAITKPGAGNHIVESGYSFRFYLMLDSAYSESQPVVTTDHGNTLTPQTSDGAYIVYYVDDDVVIYIDSIMKNPDPVANERIRLESTSSAPQIWTERNTLCILIPDNTGNDTAPASRPVIRILTLGGHLYSSFESVPGLIRRQLPTGFYIVQAGKTVHKVVIR